MPISGASFSEFSRSSAPGAAPPAARDPRKAGRGALARLLGGAAALAGLAGVPIGSAVLCALGPPAAMAATPPGLVNYQGVLRSAAGAPLNGNYDMVFRFTDAPAGGTLLLTDFHTGPDTIVVTKGLFGALLGGGTLSPGTEPSLASVLANHEPVYLEIQVGAETMSPRVRLVSAGYAVNAAQLAGQAASSFLDISASGQTKAGSLTSTTGLVGSAPGAGIGVDGSTVSGAAGVRGTSTGATGATYGTYGRSASNSGIGAYGEATAATGSTSGVYGKSASTSGIGAYGEATAASGSATGVYGKSASSAGIGTYGEATAGSGAAYGVYGKSASSTGVGVYGEATAASGGAWGLYGKSASTTGLGALGSALAASGSTEGVRGQTTSPDGRGVVGGAFSTSGDARGVYGESQSVDGTGVYGRATQATGGTTGVGGDCFSTLGTGVAGVANASSGDAWGVYGATLSPDGFGVVADGDSATIGNIYATGTKFFITEHPTEPQEAIQYACLEGGESGVYQRGIGRLERGEAKIALPEHFPLVASGRMTVHVTPLEDCGGLFVPAGELSNREFTVRELGGGRSDASFSYVILAERRGFEETPVVRPVTIAQKILMSPRLTRPQKAALRKALAHPGTEPLTAAREADLFTLVHRGDYAEACRVLGECAQGVAESAPATLPLAEDREGSLHPTLVAATGEADARGAGGFGAGAREPGIAEGGSRGRDAGLSSAVADSSASRARGAVGPVAPAHPSDEAADSSRLHASPAGRSLADGSVLAIDGGPARGSGAAPGPSGTEMLPVDESVEAGDVLVASRASTVALQRGRTASDPAVVGIVAGEPGARYAEGQAPVALAGTALCKVDASYGAIVPGDLLTASPTPAHAMRSADHAAGTIVGKALEPLASGTGVIRVLVMLR